MTGHCALVLKTRLSGETLERLLSSACQRPYVMSLDGTEETLSGERKIIRITFDGFDDRVRFKVALQQLAAATPSARTHPDKPRVRTPFSA